MSFKQLKWLERLQGPRMNENLALNKTYVLTLLHNFSVKFLTHRIGLYSQSLALLYQRPDSYTIFFSPMLIYLDSKCSLRA